MGMTISADRKERVPSDFDGVARSYDLLTSLNPGYADHLRMSAERLGIRPNERVLDLCCGTGLSTEALLRTCDRAHIIGLDASAEMVAMARKKSTLGSVQFVHGDAMAPGKAGIEGPFDAILMAYGIRNLPDPDHALSTIRDLLRPGGRVCFHEYSVADSVRSRVTWNFISWGVIIPLGFIANPKSGIYRYLRRSVLEFDGVSQFEARLRRHGFVDVQTLPMTGWQRGIVHSFIAHRPRSDA